jgi:hypothetical protein
VADTLVDYNLIVFDVRDPDLTYVYVRIDPHPGDPMDCHPSVYGWHFKAYSSRHPTAHLLSNVLFHSTEDDPLMWPAGAPKDLL